MHTCQKSNITGRSLTVLGKSFPNHSIGPARNAPHSGRMDRDLSDKVTGFHGNGKAQSQFFLWKYGIIMMKKKLMICSRFPNPKLAVGKRFSKWIVSPGRCVENNNITHCYRKRLLLDSRVWITKQIGNVYSHISNIPPFVVWLADSRKKIGQFVKLVRKQNVPWEFVIPREWPSGCVWTVPLCPSIARAIWVRLKHRVPMNPEHEHFWLKTIRLGRRLLMICNHTQVSFMWHDFLLQNQRSTTSSRALTVQDAHEHGLFPNQHKELILGQQLCYSLAVYTMAIDNPGFW